MMKKGRKKRARQRRRRAGTRKKPVSKIPSVIGMKSEKEIKYNVQPAEMPEIKFWRTFRPVAMEKSEDKEPVWFCPHNAISQGEKKLVIDYSKCDGCLICVRECHSGAIKEEREMK
ncbi:MAG: 4Fe-4S binding protein [Candidatus Aenigmarchaeota archaeon]|nr:4Fe-4S binding protein [Candidatus Aenigmarchaeota archaeon]